MATTAKSILIREHPKKKESKGQEDFFFYNSFFLNHESKAFPENFSENSLIGFHEYPWTITKGTEIAVMGLEPWLPCLVAY